MSSGKVLLSLLAGVATGALLGVLFAPEKGSTSRKNISKKSTDYANAVKEKFNEFVDSITEKFEQATEEAAEEAADATEKSKGKSKEAKKDAKTATA